MSGQVTTAAKQRGKAKPESSSSPSLGARIRHARLSRGARLKDIADLAECSESLVSKIENNRVQPSLNVLHRLCEALGTTVGEMFAIPEGNGRVVSRAGQRPAVKLDGIRQGTGILMELLVPLAKGHLMQGSIHIVAVGGSTEGQVTHHGEEIGYVISGEVEVLIDDDVYYLSAGDSAYYSSEQPHGYRNVGDDEARILFINTPPTF
jgi:transcriptional regulator with XRE-family HTH domain